jgi:methionyl-tRNA synthetase
MADEANKYLQDAAPWKTVKENPELGHQQLSTALHVGKACLALLKPILPEVAEQTETMLGLSVGAFSFENALTVLPAGTQLQVYPRLFERIDPKKVQKMVEASAEKKKKAASATAPKEMKPPETIDYDTFMQTDLRAAKVLVVEDVPKADKLYRLEVDVGPLGKRQVFVGLKNFISKEDLQGKTVVLVANLKPRKMRFGLSEGMILAAGDDKPVVLDAGAAQPGDKIS